MVELLRHIANKGGFGPGDADKLARRELQRIREAGPDSVEEFQMLDGRTIRIQRQSMQDGGHAAAYTDITELKRGEAALETSEARLRDFAELGSDWFWEMDENLRFIDFSGQFSQTLNIDENFYIGKTRREISADRLDDEHWQNHLDDLDNHRPFNNFTYRVKIPDREPLFVSINGRPIFDDDGTFLGYRGTGANISETKAINDALRESEKRFRDFSESASDWFWEMDENLRFTYISDRFTEISGVKNEDLIGKTRRNSGLDTEDEGVLRNIEDLETRRPFKNFEHVRVRPDGRVVHMSTAGTPIFDDDGAFRGYRGTGADITERKQAEEALKAGSAQLLATIECSPGAVVIRDFDGRNLIANKTFGEWYNFDRDEIIGKTTFDYLPPAISDEVVAQEREVMETRKIVVAERRVTFPDGVTRDVFSQKFPIFDADGDCIAVGTIVNDITDIKRTQDALKESEQRFRAFLDNLPIGVNQKDREGRFEFVNKQLATWYGIAEEDLIGRTAAEALGEPVSDQAGRLRDERQLLESAVAVSREVEKVRADGRSQTVVINKFPIFDSDGNLTAFGTSSVDITERKEAEEALRRAHGELEQRVEERTRQLRESEERIRSIVETAVDGIITINRRGVIDSFNAAAGKIFGYPAKQMIGKNVSMLMPEPHAGRHDGYLSHYLETGEAKIIGIGREVQALRENGEVFPMSLAVSEFRLGETSVFTGIVRDLSELKQAQDELRISEDRLSKSQTFANVGTFDRNIETGELHWSERAPTMFGFEPGEQTTTFERFAATIHPDDRAWEAAAKKACIEEGARYDVEYRVIWPDGSVHWINSRADAVRDADGKPVRFVGMLRDITARKKAEEALQTAVDTANRANLAKSAFLSSMSHELRTPLNAVLGFGQMLEGNSSEPLTESQRFCVDHITSGGRHLLELINDVLELAQIEAGKINVSLTDVSVMSILDDCLPMVEGMAEQRGIEIVGPRHELARDIVRADAMRLRQILLNLLSNAVKYNRDGGAVTIELDDSAGDMLRIGIADTGMGIASNRQGELFQPFSRLGVENSKIEGTGIGLTVTKQLVELMGGDIGFESTFGKGSTFWIELPLADKDAIVDDEEAVTSDRDALNSLTGIYGTLLYVEDNPANLELMEIIVSRIDGLTMISADNAELGLELARSRLPDIIILDINLPGMNGFEALKALQCLDETADIPVLALSASAMPVDIESGIEAGFRSYLTKPISVEEVITAIRQALKSAPETTP